MVQQELNLFDFWLIVRRRRQIVLFAIVLVATLTVTIPYFFGPEPVYKSISRVRYQRSTTVTGLLQERVNYFEGNELETQAEVATSFPVMERVAKALGRIDKTAPSQLVRSSPELLAICYEIQGHLEAVQEGTTNIIKITATAADPQLAERYATLTAEAYREENIHNLNRQVLDAKQFVEEQLAALQRSLNESEEALRAFKEQEGQVFVTEEARQALDQYQKLEVEVERIQRVKLEVAIQLESLKNNSALPGEGHTRVYSDEVEALISSLNKRMVDLMQERGNLLINYTPKHALVRELDRKIHNVKDEIIRELEAKLGTFSDRQRALQESISRYRERYLSLPEAAVQLARLERDVSVNANLYASLKAKHQEFMIRGAEQIEEVTIIAPGVVPSRPTNAPNFPLNAFLGLLMGVMVGLVTAFLQESFDTSIGTIEEVEAYLKVPVLGVIPRVDRKEIEQAIQTGFKETLDRETLDLYFHLLSLFDRKSQAAEGYRSLRTNLQFAGGSQGLKAISFVSAAALEGKTTTVVNLAITLAQDGKRILLIDADLRKPRVHSRLGLPQSPGLSEVLIGTNQYPEVIRTVTDLMLGKLGVDQVVNTPGIDNLNIITSGTLASNPSEFLNSPQLKELIETWKLEYDMIIFDCPPVLPVADAVTLGARVDGVVMVYQVGRVGRRALRRTKSLLTNARANLVGVVLSNVSPEVAPEYYGYASKYQ